MTTMANFKRVSTFHTHGNTYEVVRFELKGMTEEMKNWGWNEVRFGTIDKRYIHNGMIQVNLSMGELWPGNTVAEALDNREKCYEYAAIVEKLKKDGIIK